MPTMRAVEIPRPKGAFQLVEREVPVPEAYERMMSGKARFRVVLTT